MKCISDWGKCGLQLGLRIPVLVPVLMLVSCYKKVSTLPLKHIFFCSFPTKSVYILGFCWSLNILGLHLPLQSASSPPPQTCHDKYSLSSSSLYSTLLTLVLPFFFLLFFFLFHVPDSRLCTQFSSFLISCWLHWLAQFLDFFPPLHFSTSFNLPHCGVILES